MAYDEQVQGSVNDPSGEKTKSRRGRPSRKITETGAGQVREGKRGRKPRTEREAVPGTVEEPKRRGWPKGKKRKPAEAEIVSEATDAAGEAANRFVWHKVAEEVPPEGERVLVRRDCDRLLSRCYDTFLREAQQTDEDIRADMGLRGYVDWMTIPE